jgi:ankyrin repeat protein
VELLLNSGADIEHSKNTVYATPLTTAVLSQRSEMVRLLLSHGADAGIHVYPDAQPLIDLARKEGNLEIVRLIEAHRRPT